MGISLTVDSSSFDEKVIQSSFEKPVLVDFFAQWCGPCQMLKPVLEKLVEEYDFVLAKVDIDQNPDLANAYHIEGVPDVRVVSQGTVKPGFVGVLPEPKLRDLLASLGLKSSLDAGLEAIQAAMKTGDVEKANDILNQLLTQYPNNRQFQISAARFLMTINELDQAEQVLASIREDDRQYFRAAEAIRGLIQLQRFSLNPVVETDLDEVFLNASRAALGGDYETSLMLFLEVLSRDRTYKNEAARKAMLTLFDILGADHSLTRHYRKQLMLMLY
ncbi:MAG: tetratricopeptide repeat protein [Elainellaceae cyanobacterium]